MGSSVGISKRGQTELRTALELAFNVIATPENGVTVRDGPGNYDASTCQVKLLKMLLL